jgi:hypothetical protein
VASERAAGDDVDAAPRQRSKHDGAPALRLVVNAIVGLALLAMVLAPIAYLLS